MPHFISFIQLFNERCGFSTPDHHVEMATWLEACWHSPSKRGMLLAFRSSGKSTIVGLFCAYLLSQNKNLRILVVSAEQTLAKKMIRAVKRIIEVHPDTQNLKPPKKELWAADQFIINRDLEIRDPSMMARGIGANITGTRADVIICDDVEVPKNRDSPLKREELREKLSDLDYVITPQGMQLYIGTPHTYETIYQTTKKEE